MEYKRTGKQLSNMQTFSIQYNKSKYAYLSHDNAGWAVLVITETLSMKLKAAGTSPPHTQMLLTSASSSHPSTSKTQKLFKNSIGVSNKMKYTDLQSLLLNLIYEWRA